MSEIQIGGHSVKKIMIGEQTIYEPVNPVTALPQPLPTTKKTLTMLSGTCDVNVTPYIKIRDAAGVSRSVEEWHARAVQNGFVTTGVAAPVGVDIEAWGRHFVYYFNNKYNEPAGAAKNYYDVTGTTLISNGCLRHSHYNIPMDTFANGGTKTFNGVTATATVDGDYIVLSTSNSPFTFRIKKGITTRYGFLKDAAKDEFDALVAYTEFFRLFAAIDSGKTTTDADGTKYAVSILNASGVRPSAGEDMYFWIGGENTNIKAKYNITGASAASGIMTGTNLTQAIADSIYDKQVANGVTMNDNAANIEGVSGGKVIVTEGAKGAEAYAYGGKIYITTPIITNADNGATTIYSTDKNVPDAPAVSWVKKFGEDNNLTTFMPDEQMLEAVFTNKTSCINSIITYLNKGAGVGENWGVRSIPSESAWCAARSSATSAWYVNLSGGSCYHSSTYGRYVAVPVSAL